MLPQEPPWQRMRTHHDVVRYYHTRYDEQLRAGDIEPFVYPYTTFSALIVLFYLLIPYGNRSLLRNARIPVFILSTWVVARTIRYTRAKAMAPALGIGLLLAWGIIWVFSIMVLHDPQRDFQRIERMESDGKQKESDDETEDGTGTNSPTKNDSTQSPSQAHFGPRKRHGEFFWQPYPLTPFSERIDWVLDLFCNFRGAGWNWRTSSIPPPPSSVQTQTARNSRTIPRHSKRQHSGQPHVYTTRRDLLISNLKLFSLGYLIFDGILMIMMHDRYFWGQVTAPPPSYLPTFITHSEPLTRIYRLALTQLGVKWALQTLFRLSPLFFSGLLGPSLLGARAEPWMYPETWGPYFIVFDRGLAGWWSAWWHQTFRYAFEQPGTKLVSALRMNSRSPPAKLLKLGIAFALSGFLHACGSYTSPGPSEPLGGPMRFFLLQAVGIFLEEVLITQPLKRVRFVKGLPQWVRRTATFVYVHVWFYYTGPLLADDFAKTGIWMLEPVPLSLWRGIGFGVEGDGWFRWRGGIATWYTGTRWWRSGIAV